MHAGNSTAPPMECGHSLQPSTEWEEVREGEMYDDVLFYMWDFPSQTYGLIHCCS